MARLKCWGSCMNFGSLQTDRFKASHENFNVRKKKTKTVLAFWNAKLIESFLKNEKKKKRNLPHNSNRLLFPCNLIRQVPFDLLATSPVYAPLNYVPRAALVFHVIAIVLSAKTKIAWTNKFSPHHQRLLTIESFVCVHGSNGRWNRFELPTPPGSAGAEKVPQTKLIVSIHDCSSFESLVWNKYSACSAVCRRKTCCFLT